MHLSKRVLTVTKRNPLVGPLLWISTLQYFVVQLLVSLRYFAGYSPRFNTISDLGNTRCGQYGSRLVCSPLHSSMNASFILLGIAQILGAIMLYPQFLSYKRSQLGFMAIAIAGFGTIIVGLFPENTIAGLHILGAALPFFVGNIGLLLLGITLPIGRVMRIYTIGIAALALTGLVLFLLNDYIGLGVGGMERIVAYPQTVWLITFGVYLLAKQYKRSASPK